MKVEQKELTDLFVDFLNENSMFWVFKTYIEERAYNLKELGMDDE